MSIVMPDDIMTIYLLASLTESWKPLVTALETRKEPLDLEKTMDMILEEAECNKLRSKLNALSAQA